jgi:hypothetical protein
LNLKSSKVGQKFVKKGTPFVIEKGGGFGRVVGSTEQVILELLAKVGLIFTLAY